VLLKEAEKKETDLIIEARKSVENFAIQKNEMTESMKGQTITVVEIALRNFDNCKTIKSNISSTLQAIYGYNWFCSINSEKGEFSFSYIPNTLIVLTIGEIEIRIFQTNIPNMKVNFKYQNYI
jgi:hypothetical protein